ncbi:hypothetical protein QQF64_035843 [Cirrhinus molitorella]|uniref:Uncharacterized protein n=1 Tax=Cirrhinus molitorella TaxID=172907 RepID=A0ABR3NHW1_9TELE
MEGLLLLPKGAASEDRVPLARFNVSDRGLPLHPKGLLQTRRPKGATTLLHREEEPHPPESTQRNSNGRQRAHTATEGSRGPAALEGRAQSNAEMKFEMTAGGPSLTNRASNDCIQRLLIQRHDKLYRESCYGSWVMIGW